MPTRVPIELRVQDDRVTLQDAGAVPERVRGDLERCLELLNRELARRSQGVGGGVWAFLLSLLDW